MTEVVDDQNFEAEVLGADGPVLVEFWADWCPPCRQLAPILDQIATERAGTLRVAKMNYDENPVTPTAYRVMGLPTMILFHHGEPIASIVGARSKASLLRDVDAALQPV
jgi:thioredoxin 1